MRVASLDVSPEILFDFLAEHTVFPEDATLAGIKTIPPDKIRFYVKSAEYEDIENDKDIPLILFFDRHKLVEGNSPKWGEKHD